MADMSWQNPKTQHGSDSAVLDMDMVDVHSDVSDYDNQFQETPASAQGVDYDKKGDGSMMDNIKQKMGENVTQMVWQAGAQSAKRAWSLYGNIDVLRPYFDVEPKVVQMRLLYSLIPMKPTDQRISVPKELYGPTMIILTLIALLLYQMKSADHVVEEGTLMGSAFGVCFMYWFGASALVWFVSYVCNVRMAILQILSMMGYALFGHCIVLFLGTAVHTSHDHMFFYVLWAGIGGLSSLRMASIILSRARGQKERTFVIGAIVALHMLFLLYLYFAYHTIVEEISEALGGDLVPAPVAQISKEAMKPVDANVQQPAMENKAAESIDNLASLTKVPGNAIITNDNGNNNNVAVNPMVNTAVNDTLKAVKSAGQVTVAAVVNKGSVLLEKLRSR